jgi:hypothetical protein
MRLARLAERLGKDKQDPIHDRDSLFTEKVDS